MTDIATGWTINRSVKNKAAIWVFEAIEHVHRPVPLPDPRHRLGQRLRVHQRTTCFNYCTEHKITFTRSRPGNKNDGAHVEQKNWTHVRELVGYLRFDTEAELAVLNEIWALDGALHQLPPGPAEARRPSSGSAPRSPSATTGPPPRSSGADRLGVLSAAQVGR